MTKVYAPHLAIIRESVAAIDSYRPADRERFLDEPVVQDAVLMRLQVIGEQLARIRRIDGDRFATIADPTWYKIIGLRNVISHGYEVIRWDEIWRYISTDFTAFVESLDRLTENHGQP